MKFSDVVLAAGARTPFGDFGKSFNDVPLATLGTHAAKASIARAGLRADQVDHLVFGVTAPVDHDGLLISRKVALEAGLPEESASLSVVRACGTGSQAIISAAEQILTGHSHVAVAAGGENYSRVPYLSHSMRWGAGRGPVQLVDGLDYIYRCPFSRELMGDTAENLAARFGYLRQAMDDWGYLSQMRAKAAIESGFLARQIAPIEVPGERGAARLFTQDEFPRPAITREKLASLKPAFKRDGGQVTAGNSSGVTDGAAAIIVRLLPPYHWNASKRLIKAPKLYFNDVGLAAYLLGILEEGHVNARPLRGALFENLVVMEALKWFWFWHRGQRAGLSFYRDSNGNEVDLLIKLVNGIFPIEIKAGQTVSTDYFKGLRNLAKLYETPPPSGGAVVYGGDESGIRYDTTVMPPAGLATFLSRLTGTAAP